MNKSFLIVAVVLLVVLCGVILSSQTQSVAPQNQQQKKSADTSIFAKKQLSLNGETHTFWIADTDQKQEQGLMFVTRLPDDVYGMAFLFNESRVQSFWNKNTLLHLTLYWVQGDTVIGTSDLPSITESKEVVTVTSPGPADKVFEVPVSGK